MQYHNESQDDIEELAAKLKAAKAQQAETKKAEAAQRAADKEAKAAQKAADKEAKEKAKEQKAEMKKEANEHNGLLAALEFVENSQIYYISALDRYLVKDEEKKWTYLKASALYRTYPELGDSDFAAAFTLAMQSCNRIFLDCTYSFNEYPNTLNKMDRSDWLTPLTGQQHHWLFDVLIQSLGADKPENMEHLKHVIAYKYLHPECWLLPCLVIYGEGRIGKNLLVDSVLYTVFAKQTISATADNLISTFNSLLEGKMVVCVNETVAGKHDRAKLYNQLAKARTEINMKGTPQYTVDNSGLFFIGSNDWNGGTMLDRSMADERLSILCCPKGLGLKHWVAKHMGCSPDEAQQWLWTEGGKIAEDKIEVARWLGYLIANYGDKPQPEALHGADYAEVMGVQSKIEESMMEAVFRDPAFDHIGVVDLFDGYLAVCKSRNIKFTIGMKLFNRQIEMWLVENKLKIEKITKSIDTSNFVDGRKVRSQIQKTVWATNPDTALVDNRSDYLTDDRSDPRWIGAEII